MGWAVYILNRTRRSSIEAVSPYELWIGNTPRIKYLRIIGSACYANILSEKWRKAIEKKIDDRDECFRIWIRESHKITLSRDTQFEGKLRECADPVVLPFEDILKESSVQEKFKDNRKKGDLDSDSENYKTELDTDSEDNQENSSENKTGVKLRDRLLLKKPSYLKDYVMRTDSFINRTDLESYEDALWC